jgi:DNA-binding CsgD family transcriptional regulator
METDKCHGVMEMNNQKTIEAMSFQDALRSPLVVYEAISVVESDTLCVNLIKILIDYKRGRLRQAYKRYKTVLASYGFDPNQDLVAQTALLDEKTVQLVVFELVFHMTNMTPDRTADINTYIDVLDLLGPDDRVLQGALYNILLTFALRDGTHAVATQFAALAIEEYRAGAAPYLEGFIHLHLALVHIAQANYVEAKKACATAYDLFCSVPETAGERAQVSVVTTWIDLEHRNVPPDPGLFDTVKSTMLAGELWSETILMLATVLFRSKILTAQDDLLEVHAELETVIRVRRMTSLLPAMQLLRDEFFATGAHARTSGNPVKLDDFQLLLLQPTMTTLVLNGNEAALKHLPRLKVIQDLQHGQAALTKRQFSVAADHVWPALDLIEKHQMLGVLQAALPTIETFLAECRARRRFVERTRDIRNRFLLPMRKPKAAVAVPSGLTATEYVIVTLLPQATSNKAMARQLDVSEQTIKFHLVNIYRKLGVHRRRDAIKASAARGWINLGGAGQSGT